MKLLFKVQDVFYVSGRGCVLCPQLFAEKEDFRVRARDQLQLRTPDGRVLDTYIAPIELAKPSDNSACQPAIMLPPELEKKDVPVGTEVWLVNWPAQ